VNIPSLLSFHWPEEVKTESAVSGAAPSGGAKVRSTRGAVNIENLCNVNNLETAETQRDTEKFDNARNLGVSTRVPCLEAKDASSQQQDRV
jgi:hypothetical protein